LLYDENGKQMDTTLLQFLCNNVTIYFYVETLDLLQCILLSHCHNIKEMTTQKGLWNLEEDKLVVEFHM